MSDIIVFTDGASRGNPGPGGYGAIVATDDRVAELGGNEENTTNNRMELRGLIAALEYIDSNSLSGDIEAHLDSQYVMRGTKEWLPEWQKNGWKTKAKKDVLNPDLWRALAELLERVQEENEISWVYVGGHVGIPGNERVDQIATRTADGEKLALYSGPREQYPVNLSVTEGIKEKTKKKSRSDKPAYSYVSLVDGILQIHKTWAECEKRVKGVSKARYQKALSPEEESKIVKSFLGN